MSIRSRKVFQHIVAMFIIIMLIRYHLFGIEYMRPFIADENSQLLTFFLVLFYLLNIITMVCLLKSWRVSILLAIVSILFSTVLFRVSYWPFIIDSFFSGLPQYIHIAKIAGNMLLVLALFSQKH